MSSASSVSPDPRWIVRDVTRHVMRDSSEMMWLGLESARTLTVPGLPSHVMTGEMVNMELPWLVALYKHDMRKIVAEVVGYTVDLSEHEDASVNVDYLGTGERIGPHIDRHAATAVLFVDDRYRGGETALSLQDGSTKVLRPYRGQVLVFEGDRIQHEVLAVSYGVRITVAMNYFRPGVEQTWRMRDFL